MMGQRGGQVIVASEPGAGTTVTVCFPAQAVAVGQARDDDAQTAVLVVDDDEWVRNVTARILRRAGYGVLEADRGESALELLRDAASDGASARCSPTSTCRGSTGTAWRKSSGASIRGSTSSSPTGDAGWRGRASDDHPEALHRERTHL